MSQEPTADRSNDGKRTPRRSRIPQLIGVLLLVIGVYAMCRDSTGSRARPNVVIVVLDTARWDRFGFMGYTRDISPGIDALAAEGVVFNQAYTTCFWTLPSHASLFTGKSPTVAQSTSETEQLPKQNLTLAEILNRHGYETFGASSNAWISIGNGFSQGFENYAQGWGQESQRPEDVVVRETLGWLNSRGEDDRPFFLFVNLTFPHLPYQPSPPVLEEWISPEHNRDDVLRVGSVTNMWGHFTGERRLSPADLEILGELYDGEIVESDIATMKIIEGIRSLGELDNTIVIITSDHGENLGEHGMIDHAISMYETTIRIPMMIRYPPRLKAGQRADLVSLIDVMPTVLDLCDLPAAEPEGSWAPALSLFDPDRTEARTVIAENERPNQNAIILSKDYPDFDRSKIDHSMRAIRMGRYKLIRDGDNPLMLFDLLNDPDELNNIADEKPDVRQSLVDALHRSMQGDVTALVDINPTGLSDADLQRLRTLGYVSSTPSADTPRSDPDSVVNLDGVPTDPLADTQAKATVLLFVTTDCPISNRYVPEMRRIEQKYAEQNIAFFLVFPDPDDDAAKIRNHLQEYDLQIEALRDPQHVLVARAEASVTPEAAVFAADGQRVYHGRIDNWYVDFGKNLPQATEHDLDQVLSSITADEPVTTPNAPAVGCYIRDLR